MLNQTFPNFSRKPEVTCISIHQQEKKLNKTKTRHAKPMSSTKERGTLKRDGKDVQKLRSADLKRTALLRHSHR